MHTFKYIQRLTKLSIKHRANLKELQGTHFTLTSRKGLPTKLELALSRTLKTHWALEVN